IFFGSSSVLYHWIKQCSIPFIGLHAQGSSAQFGAHDRMTLIASFTWVMGSTAPLRDQLRRSIDRSSRSIARGTVIAPADRILRALAGGLASIDLRADLLAIVVGLLIAVMWCSAALLLAAAGGK